MMPPTANQILAFRCGSTGIIAAMAEPFGDYLDYPLKDGYRLIINKGRYMVVHGEVCQWKNKNCPIFVGAKYAGFHRHVALNGYFSNGANMLLQFLNKLEEEL